MDARGFRRAADGKADCSYRASVSDLAGAGTTEAAAYGERRVVPYGIHAGTVRLRPERRFPRGRPNLLGILGDKFSPGRARRTPFKPLRIEVTPALTS